MGLSKYLDSLSPDQYKALSKELWEIQNHKCYICGEDIDLDVQTTNIDHIHPLVTGGKDERSNFAITHEHCNKSKQDADLAVAKRIVCLDKIIKQAERNHESPSLKHVLLAYGGSKFNFKYKVENDTLVYSFDEIGDLSIKKSEIFTDELSHEQTAFISVPLEYLFHDDILNPRGLNRSVSLLIKEFYKPNPQLQIPIARIADGKIMLFDGQHKTVAQIMLGVNSIVVRVFINPDTDRLMETNLNAGKKLRQIAFDKAIVRQLHDTLYAERIKKYQADHGLDEDNFDFSEQQLIDYFKGERGNIKVYIINSQKNAITHDPHNKLLSYINFEGRGYTLPLSYSTFEKTFLSTFVNAKTVLSTPINYRAEEGLNPRTLEKEQLVRLCNIIAETFLIGKYNEDVGTNKIESNIANGKDSSITDDHLIACRFFKEEVMYNWVKYIELLIKNHFAFTGEMFNDQNLFQQAFNEKLWDNIRTFLENMHELPIWKDRSAAATIFGGKNPMSFWATIFSKGETLNGTKVLAQPINVAEMIKK